MGDSIQGDGELMGRLIRQLIIAGGVFLLLPGMAAAQQIIQNSGTGELNGLSLDLTQATITLTRNTLVNPINSTVTVNPPVVRSRLECCCPLGRHLDTADRRSRWAG